MEESRASGARSPQLIAYVALAAAVVALVLGALAGGAGGGSTLAADIDAKADNAKFQSVTLNNGTVYYAKVGHKGESLVLSNVYYLTGATSQNPQGSLVKRGAEIHAPDGDLVVNAVDVLAVDDVGKNSIIARGIDRIESGDTAATTTTAAP